MVSQEKRAFLTRLADGMLVCMTGRVDAIVDNTQNECEALIAIHFIEYAAGRPWFSIERYRHAMETLDDRTLTDILMYLDHVDVGLQRVFMATYIDTDTLDASDQFYAREIIDECVYSFEHFITFET